MTTTLMKAVFVLTSALSATRGLGESTVPAGPTSPRWDHFPAVRSIALHPLAFESLRSDGASSVFVARDASLLLTISPAGATIVLDRPSSRGGAALRMDFLGADRTAVCAGDEELPGRVHDYIGKDPSQWRTGLPTYSRVTCRNVYPGVDVVYHGDGRSLEYDFVVGRQARTRRIRMAFEHADRIRLDASGDLVLEKGGHEFRHRRPVVTQDVSGVRRTVRGGFELTKSGEVRLEIGPHDRSRPLLVGPVLTYSTFLGGTSDEIGNGIALDSSGNFYVVGTTASADFPIRNVAPPLDAIRGTDAFVAKYAPDGTRLWSAVLGGDDTFADYGNGIAVDGDADVYVTGQAGSRSFPTTGGAFQESFAGGSADAFVARLSTDGALQYATYLGGFESDGVTGNDVGFDVAAFGRSAVVVGVTASRDFPHTPGVLQDTYGGTGVSGVNGLNGLGDAFIARLDPTGSSLEYSTFLGGSGDDLASDVAVNATGHVYVTGTTFSEGLATSSAYQPHLRGMADAFIGKLAPDGSGLLYFTYLGGSDAENTGRINYEHHGLAIDPAGNAYVSGETYSDDFPLLNALQSNRHNTAAFVTKLDPSGSALVYSTFLGCLAETAAHGIALDGAGNAFVTGRSHEGFPILNGLTVDLSGSPGAFLTKISADGSSMAYSTFLGKLATNEEGAHGVAVDDAGNSYVTGETRAVDYPSTPGSDQPMPAGGSDAFISVVHSENESPAPVPIANVDPDYTSPADPGLCTAHFQYGFGFSNATPCVEWTTVPSLDQAFPVGVNAVQGTVHDVTGAGSSFSFTFTVTDQQGPSLSCPAAVQADTACGRSSADVSYASPQVTDNCPGVRVECSPASGSAFPAGDTTVSCTATDPAANAATCSFAVTVHMSSPEFTGFLAPLGGSDQTGGTFASPLRTFHRHRTIPVKFIASCGGAALSGVQTIQLIPYSDASSPGQPVDGRSTDAATVGNQFRLTGGTWHFNLDPKRTGLGPGIWKLVVTLSDGSDHFVWIAID